ncbi:hypothetical protein PHYPSEUDO_013325 [Phytophthora pseudosyringae]|uniref:Calmodulin n=1 Tax=Phytophthora pseudosyringae TaxID=221518 RepID=A0A8T1W2T1_9STRA|nr:hypothetical protein PHYPSEUDO_013325 [Phytophthora pseudosyringae]
MTTVLQRVKDKRLTPAQECESRTVFELAAEGSDTMTVKQLKMCLQALGLNVAKGEAQALVYEFDYTDTNTIDLADFQKIFLSKTLESSERSRFDQAFRSKSDDTSDKVSMSELSSALRVSELHANDHGGGDSDAMIDISVLRQQMASQHYDDADSEAVTGFLGDTDELRVSKAALAAFLRV